VTQIAVSVGAVSISLRARMHECVCLSVCLSVYLSICYLITFPKGSAVTRLRAMIVLIYAS